jgi:hypothetical protein
MSDNVRRSDPPDIFVSRPSSFCRLGFLHSEKTLLFLKKKKQKDLSPGGGARLSRCAIGMPDQSKLLGEPKVFLLFFFRKRRILL